MEIMWRLLITKPCFCSSLGRDFYTFHGKSGSLMEICLLLRRVRAEQACQWGDARTIRVFSALVGCCCRQSRPYARNRAPPLLCYPLPPLLPCFDSPLTVIKYKLNVSAHRKPPTSKFRTNSTSARRRLQLTLNYHSRLEIKCRDYVHYSQRKERTIILNSQIVK